MKRFPSRSPAFTFLLFTFAFFHCHQAHAQPKPQTVVPLPTESLEGFSKLLKEVLVQNLPPVLDHEHVHNWGQQAMVPSLQGFKVIRVQRNHGNWQRTRAITGHLVKHLELRVHSLHVVDGDRLKFKIFLAVPTTVIYRQQTWQNGVLIVANHARARLRIKLDLSLETRLKLEQKSDALPDVLIDCKVADARISYDNFVLENVNGVGGTAARLTGEAVRLAVNHLVPAVERLALAKGREAILKAGEKREVRISLAKLAQLPSFKSAK